MGCTTRNTTVTHSLLNTPECPLPLLGRDWLCKLNAAQLHVPPEKARKAQTRLLTKKSNGEEDIPEERSDAVIPLAWAAGTPAQTKNVQPAKNINQMEIRSSAGKEKNQRLIKLEARKGLEPVINSLLEHGQLRDCQSEFNTPVLPAKKPHYHEQLDWRG